MRRRSSLADGAPDSSGTTLATATNARSRLVASAVAGLVGYAGMVLTGTQLAPLPNPPTGTWWFSLPAGHVGLLRILFYVATVIAIAGWIGVGTVAWRGQLSVRAGVVILAVWSLPLLLGPPIFSKDVYSYVGQGLIAHRGLNPYTRPPAVLGNGPLLRSIASVWRHSPAPYGPFFVEIARGITAVVTGSIVSEVLAMRGARDRGDGAHRRLPPTARAPAGSRRRPRPVARRPQSARPAELHGVGSQRLPHGGARRRGRLGVAGGLPFARAHPLCPRRAGQGAGGGGDRVSRHRRTACVGARADARGPCWPRCRRCPLPRSSS